MIEQATNLATQSDSTIIILIVVLVCCIIALIPVIRLWDKMNNKKFDREAKKRTEEYKREDRFIQVIEKNTEVNSALKMLIEADQKHCDQCKAEQRDFFSKIFDKQETANEKLTRIEQKLEA